MRFEYWCMITIINWSTAIIIERLHSQMAALKSDFISEFHRNSGGGQNSPIAASESDKNNRKAVFRSQMLFLTVIARLVNFRDYIESFVERHDKTL
jgi:hypothetical protein